MFKRRINKIDRTGLSRFKPCCLECVKLKKKTGLEFRCYQGKYVDVEETLLNGMIIHYKKPGELEKCLATDVKIQN